MTNRPPVTGPVEVGGALLRGNLFLAPVAGYSDAPFRSVCLDHGADFCFTEMVSSEALTRDSRRTLEIMKRAGNEPQYAIQLFGSDPDTMARAAEIASRLEPTLIDVNSGCPVPKVSKSGAGAILMKTPEKLAAIIKAMSDATAVPVTVKIRSGWDHDSMNFLEVAAACRDSGAKAVTLHARTRTMGYSGKADWDQIGRLKRSLDIPVFASGDAFTPEAILALFEVTGCDGVMVARGAMGNPFIFERAKLLARGLKAPTPTHAEIALTARVHLSRFAEAAGERLACVEFRKHFCSYTKGLPHGAELRNGAVKATTLSDYETLFERLSSVPDLPRGG
jgi:tRNA-dihydrouridine synthase B